MMPKAKATKLLLDGKSCCQQLTRHSICLKKFGDFFVASSIRQLVFLAFPFGSTFRATTKGCAFGSSAAVACRRDSQNLSDTFLHTQLLYDIFVDVLP